VTRNRDLNLFGSLPVWLSSTAKAEDWFTRRNSFVRAIDVGAFSEVAPVSLCDDEATPLKFQGDSTIDIRTTRRENGDVAPDHCNAVTVAGVCRRTRFSFVFGGAGEFDAEVVMINRPNFELARWRCPGAVDLGGRDTRVIGGPDRDN
jgi:hypothetical protein